MRHTCQKTWESTVENGQQAKQSEIELLIQVNSKLQDLIVYTDGSVRMGLHCQARCDNLHEDSAAYTVSTSSLTMEMEAFTHALRWIAP